METAIWILVALHVLGLGYAICRDASWVQRHKNDQQSRLDNDANWKALVRNLDCAYQNVDATTHVLVEAVQKLDETLKRLDKSPEKT